MLWSDEAPFQLFSIPNRQNDRVWAQNSNQVEPYIQVKFPGKKSRLGYDVPPSSTTFAYCPTKTNDKWFLLSGLYFEKTCKDAIDRHSENGSILDRPMLPDMSKLFFMQDGAPAHTAKMTQLGLQSISLSSGVKFSGQAIRLI